MKKNGKIRTGVRKRRMIAIRIINVEQGIINDEGEEGLGVY